jgi:transaldolase
MKPTRTLHDLGQSLWLDNITRELLNSGTLQGYIDEFSVTGLTSNPTIFDHAIKNSTTYDADISRKALSTQSAEDLFFELALADLSRTAECVPARLRPDRWGGRLGVVGGLTLAGP